MGWFLVWMVAVVVVLQVVGINREVRDDERD